MKYKRYSGRVISRNANLNWIPGSIISSFWTSRGYAIVLTRIISSCQKKTHQTPLLICVIEGLDIRNREDSVQERNAGGYLNKYIQ